MRRPLPPTATPACARASPRPLLAPPVDSVAAGSTAPQSRGPQRDRETSSRAAAARAGVGSHPSVGRPLPPAGRSLKGARVEPGSPFPEAPPPGNAVFSPAGKRTARASSARGPKEHWHCRSGAGSLLLFRSDRCFSAPAAQVWSLRCSLQRDQRMASHPHATSEILFYLVRAVFPHSPQQKVTPPPPPPRGPEFGAWPLPRPAAATAPLTRKFIQYGKQNWDGGRGLFPKMLPTRSDSGNSWRPRCRAVGRRARPDQPRRRAEPEDLSAPPQHTK